MVNYLRSSSKFAIAIVLTKRTMGVTNYTHYNTRSKGHRSRESGAAQAAPLPTALASCTGYHQHFALQCNKRLFISITMSCIRNVINIYIEGVGGRGTERTCMHEEGMSVRGYREGWRGRMEGGR